MKSVPLPSNKPASVQTTTKPHQRFINKSENASWAGASGTVTVTVPGDTLYLIKVKLAAGLKAAIITLSHPLQMSQEELDAAIAEASKVVNEVRIPRRRAEMAENRTRVDDPKAMNLIAFEWDVEFFETVMCDKFGFRRILTVNGNATIDVTAKVSM
jgi:hypothetical protein